MQKVIVRVKNLNIKQPFLPEDKDGAVIVETIRKSVIEIAKTKGEIERAKDLLKDLENDRVEAENALAAGKERLTPCTVKIYHEENMVRIYHKAALVEERPITDEDRQAEMEDKEIEE